MAWAGGRRPLSKAAKQRVIALPDALVRYVQMLDVFFFLRRIFELSQPIAVKLINYGTLRNRCKFCILCIVIFGVPKLFLGGAKIYRPPNLTQNLAHRASGNNIHWPEAYTLNSASIKLGGALSNSHRLGQRIWEIETISYAV